MKMPILLPYNLSVLYSEQVKILKRNRSVTNTLDLTFYLIKKIAHSLD